MPASLKDLRLRIKSVTNTEQITKAMKLVSTAKFGRAQNTVLQAKAYTKSLSRMVSDLVASVGPDATHPLLTQSASLVDLVIVISSERGLCGSYNANIARAAVKTIDEIRAKGRQPHILCIGKKAYQVLTRRYRAEGLPTIPVTITQLSNLEVSFSAPGFTLIQDHVEKKIPQVVESLSKALQKEYENCSIGSVQCVYTKFESAGVLPLTHASLLPIAKPEGGEALSEPIMEPAASELLAAMLSRYFKNSMNQILLEAFASEHCARMAAMDSATRNAKDMLRKLQITYQRARQASITRELIEIISGAEAL